jgi:hypothetical protein
VPFTPDIVRAGEKHDEKVVVDLGADEGCDSGREKSRLQSKRLNSRDDRQGELDVRFPENSAGPGSRSSLVILA